MSNFVINPSIVAPAIPEGESIECQMINAPAGNNYSIFGLSDDPSSTVKGDYGIGILSTTEVQIYQDNQAVETGFDPSTLTSPPYIYKIVLTESEGSITSCTYTVNGVTMTPSFAFSAIGSTGKTGQLWQHDAIVTGTAIQLHTSGKKWVTVNSYSQTISTTTNPDDTATKNVSSCSAYCHYVTMGDA